jgi:phosphotransferase system  glucose/maltose/N-acetylglucosamine-specific IIC component
MSDVRFDDATKVKRLNERSAFSRFFLDFSHSNPEKQANILLVFLAIVFFVVLYVVLRSAYEEPYDKTELPPATTVPNAQM